MANLFKMEYGKVTATVGILAEEGLTGELADAIKKDRSLARVGIDAILAELARRNAPPTPKSFTLSVEEQLSRFKATNVAQGWGFCEEVFQKLAQSAPEWPEGALCVRSLRIRFGEGDAGVAKTFEAHAAEVKRVFGAEQYWRWEHLRSGSHPYEGKDVPRLRLLAGNKTHRPVIEWVILDLDAHRSRKSIAAVRDPSKSLADELLVVAWMFPDLIRSIDYDTVPGMFAAGYELNVPGKDEVEWRYVPFVGFDSGYGQVGLSADWHSYDNSYCSVPALRECKR